jgi:hypothetical protein
MMALLLSSAAVPLGNSQRRAVLAIARDQWNEAADDGEDI